MAPCRRKAAWKFEESLGSFDGVPRDERAVLTYLVGELWRRVGDIAQATAWFDRVANEILDPTTLDPKGPAPLNRMVSGLTTIAAMPRIDAFSGNLVAYAATPGVLGSDTLVVFDVAGCELQARLPPRVVRAGGDTVRVAVAPESIHLFDPKSEQRL